MDQYLAYPDEILEEDKINEVFEGLKVEEDDHLGNVLRMSRHFNAYHTKKLREIVDPKDWRDHHLVAVVNAFYNPQLNNFEFPAGILQGNFFDPHVPKYLNFGAIGGVIGHEITHGFDDQGRQRNSDGKKNFVKLQPWAALVGFFTVDVPQCRNLAIFLPLILREINSD